VRGTAASPRGAWAAVSANAGRFLDAVGSSARWVEGLTGWRRLAVAFAAGSLSVLAFAPFFLWPVLFFTLPVLVWLIDGAQAEGDTTSFWRRPFVRAATAGWWFGFGYFVFGLFWIGEAFLVEADKFAWLLPVAVTGLPAYLAFFFAFGAGASRCVWPQGLARILVLAIALSLTEWLRGHVLTGFPWNVLGYALTWPLPMMQSAALFGIYGLTLLAVIIFAAPLTLVADAASGRAPGRRSARAMQWAVGIAILPLLLLYGYGSWRLSDGPAPLVDGVKIRIVQASIDQRDKWKSEKQGEIFRAQLDLSRRDPTGRRDDLAGITHLIWPEAAMPFLPLEHPEALAAIGELLPDGTQMLAGALRLKRPFSNGPGGNRQGYNSLMVFSDKGTLESLYDKIHLVPFGEYLPFQATLEWMGLEQVSRWRGGFSVGPNPRPLLSVPGLPPVAVLICYEAVFPDEVVQGPTRPGLLLNVTNDGWFGDTTGPWQHFHQSRVRAVEEGVPLVRSANNGVSAIIDGQGRVLALLPLNARGVIDSGLPGTLAPPPYARFGGWTFVALVLGFVAGACVMSRKQRK
jgi:apolipoprotein N-acyltransferase